MSAQPDNNTPPDMVNIEIDGKPMQAPKGSVIIQAADNAGIPIPRFCYHRKLSTAANCRQCMVEVESGGKMVPKPQPACATPVSDGMKVFTRSENAMHWQRNVMEFELINHPLDCPVCDQGGECELQDLALGYGRSVNRFTERKRTLADENIGPLIATYMTRCIYCTRCVRVLDEVAGTPDFGSLGRSEHVKIGTYIGRSIESEMGGNIIDVCPVGALTDKPYQFRARAWELIARASIGYHDALGSNLWLHTRRGEVLRTVPRDNEAINECWLSDRDRYSYQGLYAQDRVLKPLLKRDGQWHEVEWNEALGFAADALKSVSGADLGVLVQPAASNEEGELLRRLASGLGTPHIDHRLRQLDFADAATATPFELPVQEFGHVNAALLIGSYLRHEIPLLNSRLRQASLGRPMMQATSNPAHYDTSRRVGASIHVLNPVQRDFNYQLAGETVVAPQAMVDAMLAMVGAVSELAGADSDDGEALPSALREAMASVQVDDGARAAIKALHEAESGVVMLGEMAVLHPDASWLRMAARYVAKATGAVYAEIPVGANAIGLSSVGVLPGAGGMDARAMLAQPRKGYLLFGAEPPYDFADGAQALAALKPAKVVAFSAFASDAMREVADVILPIALLPEIDATLVNVEGVSQVLAAGARPPGDARPGWRVLRALGGMLEVDGFEFDDLAELRAGLTIPLPPGEGGPSGKQGNTLSPAQRGKVPEGRMGESAAGATPEEGTGEAQRTHLAQRSNATTNDGSLVRLSTIPIYRGDAVLRRATALNAHPLNRAPAARLNHADAERLGLSDGATARVSGDASLSVVIDDAVPQGAVWIEAGYAETATLPPYGAALTLSKA